MTSIQMIDKDVIENIFGFISSDDIDNNRLGWQLMYGQFTKDLIVEFFGWCDSIDLPCPDAMYLLNFFHRGVLPKDDFLSYFKDKINRKYIRLRGDKCINPITNYLFENKISEITIKHLRDDQLVDLSKAKHLSLINVECINESFYSAPSTIKRLILSFGVPIDERLSKFDSLYEIELGCFMRIAQNAIDNITWIQPERVIFTNCDFNNNVKFDFTNSSTKYIEISDGLRLKVLDLCQFVSKNGERTLKIDEHVNLLNKEIFIESGGIILYN